MVRTVRAAAGRNDKIKHKAQAFEEKATAEGDATDTAATRDADQKCLEDLAAACQQKTADCEDKPQLRSEEHDAIDEASEISSSSSMKGCAQAHLPAFVLRGRSPASLRTRVQSVTLEFLARRGRELNNRWSSMMAVKASNHAFAKESQKIDDLVVQLVKKIVKAILAQVSFRIYR